MPLTTRRKFLETSGLALAALATGKTRIEAGTETADLVLTGRQKERSALHCFLGEG